MDPEAHRVTPPVGPAQRLLRGAPPVAPAPPWFTSFPETNVRTYVVGPDGREGLWFFSLDAARLEPVLVARSTYALPYMWSAMRVERDGAAVRYRSRRRWPGPTPAAGNAPAASSTA